MNDELFKEILEKTVFKEEYIAKLMNALNQLNSGNIEVRRAKKQAIEVLASLYKELCDLFPFYLNEVVKYNPKNATEKSEKMEQLMSELREKDDLLKQASVRLKRIEERLGAI
ncbi:MAG: hypothetical protein JW891_08035 [Candidatus Lokiarchaeota archaeon]|nr:hypothetical protein [Candidatus Lokiarchaeota archaeon]